MDHTIRGKTFFYVEQPVFSGVRTRQQSVCPNFQLLTGIDRALSAEIVP